MSDVRGVLCRRHQVKVLALASLIVAGCSDASRPVGPTGVTPNGSSQAGSPGGIALLGDPGLGPDLAAVRRATAAFHEVERAIAAGYADPRGGHCDASAVGTMGIHSPNQRLIQSQGLDPEQPEVLLYLPKVEGGV